MVDARNSQITKIFRIAILTIDRDMLANARQCVKLVIPNRFSAHVPTNNNLCGH